MSDTDNMKAFPAPGTWVIDATCRSIASYRFAFTFIRVDDTPTGKRLDIEVDGQRHVFDLERGAASHIAALLAAE